MEFALSATQQLLVGIAREFLGRHDIAMAAAAPRAGDERLWRVDDAAGADVAASHDQDTAAARAREPAPPDPMWREMAALGWPGLLIPQPLGGSGGSLLDVVLLVEEMGRAGVHGPYVESGVAATTVLLEMVDPRHERMLAAMAAGDYIVALARGERDGVAPASGIGVEGSAPARLAGRALFVRDADIAHALLVATHGQKGWSLVVVPTARAGVTLRPMPTMSWERRFEVRFDRVVIEAGEHLGPAGRADHALATGLRAGAVARAAEMVGAAQRILDLTVEHAKVRVQSGRPIGAFQAIQHTCADLLRNVEGARWVVRQAAWKVASGDAGAAVAMAKAWTAEASLAVARRAHQVFGAIGYCDEHPLHRLHKTIHAASVDFGEPHEHLETVATAIGLADA